MTGDDGEAPGRANQRRRTRKDLLQAAARLMREGRRPSLEEVAAAAMVSRATAYRYFPDVGALLVEAVLDIALPDPDALFEGEHGADPVQRLQRVDDALAAMMRDNEPALRTMLVQSLQRGAADGAPVRQNRRMPLIEAALAPARRQFRAADLKLLGPALALVLGTEAMVVFKDVLQLDDVQAQKVRRCAIRALVQAALRPDAATP